MEPSWRQIGAKLMPSRGEVGAKMARLGPSGGQVVALLSKLGSSWTMLAQGEAKMSPRCWPSFAKM
eukprot:7106251-Karenia_brevis.AAC.1